MRGAFAVLMLLAAGCGGREPETGPATDGHWESHRSFAVSDTLPANQRGEIMVSDTLWVTYSDAGVAVVRFFAPPGTVTAIDSVAAGPSAGFVPGPDTPIPVANDSIRALLSGHREPSWGRAAW